MRSTGTHIHLDSTENAPNDLLGSAKRGPIDSNLYTANEMRSKVSKYGPNTGILCDLASNKLV